MYVLQRNSSDKYWLSMVKTKGIVRGEQLGLMLFSISLK